MPDLEGVVPSRDEVVGGSAEQPQKSDGFLAKYPQVVQVREGVRFQLLKLARTAFAMPSLRFDDLEGTENAITVNEFEDRTAELHRIQGEAGDQLSPLDKIALQRGLLTAPRLGPDEAKVIEKKKVKEEEREKIDAVRSELEKLVGKRGRRAHRKRGKLGDALDTGSEKLNDLDTAISSAESEYAEEVNKSTHQTIPLAREITASFFAGAREESEKLVTTYEHALSKLLDEGELPRAIGEAYIDFHIRPIIEEGVSEGYVKPEESDAFYAAIAKMYQDKITNVEERSNLLGYFTETLNVAGIRKHLDELAKGIDFFGVNDMVSLLYRQDIEAIGEELDTLAPGQPKGDTVSAILGRATKPPGWHEILDVKEGYGKLYDNLYPGMHSGMTDIDRWGNYDLWMALRNVPEIKTLFGKEVKQIEEKNLQVLLNNSVDHPSLLKVLVNYPCPETVRNLVLIAAGKNKDGISVANDVLQSLSERSDWQAVLNEAQGQYPEFSKLRSILKQWGGSRAEQHPDIAAAVSDLSFSVLKAERAKGDEKDKKLEKLCIDASPNSSLLELLREEGALSEAEVNLFNNAEKILGEANAKKDTRENELIIANYSFGNVLRENLIGILRSSSGESVRNQQEKIRRLGAVAQRISENQKNYQGLSYLSSNSIHKALLSRVLITDEDLSAFLDAHKVCPELVTNGTLRATFAENYKDASTVALYRDVSTAYEGVIDHTVKINILLLTHKGKLTEERARELPQKALVLLNSGLFGVAWRYPQVFLTSDDGINFLTNILDSGLSLQDEELNKRIGASVLGMKEKTVDGFSDVMVPIANFEIRKLADIDPDNIVDIDETNWQSYLIAFLRINDDGRDFPPISEPVAEKLKVIFADQKTKDFCLNQFRDQWTKYLHGGDFEELPFSLSFMSSFVDRVGAGPLTQIESMSSLVRAYREMHTEPTTAPRTKQEIFQGFSEMEDRFTKEKWSNEDKANFYNISSDILKAAPSLYSNFLDIFAELNPSELRRFSRELLPMYRAKLALIGRTISDSRTEYNPMDLVAIRKDLRGFKKILRPESTPFEMQKNKLIVEMTELFKDKFGIIKVPEEFSSEQIRSLTDVSIYLANLSGRTAENEVVLGLYLALMLDDKWEDFRRGLDVNPGEYLAPEKVSVAKQYLEQRRRLNPLTPEILGVDAKDLPEFYRILQQDEQNILVGDVETIDIKLTSVILNLRGLEDLDLYPNPLDRDRVILLSDYGNRAVSAAAAKMYQRLSNPGRDISITDIEQAIQGRIEAILLQEGLEVTPDSIKAHFQDGIKPFATVANVLQTVEETKAEEEIATLRELLKPPQNVIDIFSRLGEEFTATSGAMALSQDLNYLEGLVAKREDLTDAEREAIEEYTGKIRNKVVQLQAVYEQIKAKFVSLKQRSDSTENQLLATKLDDIDRIISSQVTQQTITSAATNNLNVIIENMRECLACIVQGANNDTNLTFGDMNKFYLYSQSEASSRGSIADQIVFLEPVTYGEDGQQEMGFVFDRLYGASTPSVLESQIMTVVKKLKKLKNEYPTANLSVFVTQAAITSGGISIDILEEWLKENSTENTIEQVQGTVDVIQSASGDHYVEFGGRTRTAGARSVSGIRIK